MLGLAKVTRGPRWPCIAHPIISQVSSQLAFSVQEKVQYKFPRWRPFWISSQNDFSYFLSTNHFDTSYEVLINWLFGSKEKSSK